MANSDISHLRIRLSVSFYMKHIVFPMFFHTTSYCSCRWQCRKHKMQLIISVMKYAKFNSNYNKSKKNGLLKNIIKIHRFIWFRLIFIINFSFFFYRRTSRTANVAARCYAKGRGSNQGGS